MKKDKITAMWEEDGDLMRIKDFFAYIYQGENLKERIKNKTLARISVTDDNISAVTAESEAHQEEESAGREKIKVTSTKDKDKDKDKDNETTEKHDNNKFFLISGIKRQIKSKKSILKVFSAAAVVVFAVYLGSTGLMDGNSALKELGSNKPANQDMASTEDTGMSAPSAMPQTFASSSSISNGKMKGETVAGDIAYSTNERSMLQEENIAAADKENQQKIIYVLDATLKTDNVNATVDAVQQKVTTMGGYIAESRQTNNQDSTTAYLSLRIPVTQFESFKGDLSKFGTVSDQHLYTDDVSRQYFDVETRLRSWEAQEKRYLEILQQAKTVEEILRIEDSLANVRREMESLKGQLKYWDNRVEYSEIRLNIYPSQSNFTVNDPWQPVSPKSTFDAAKNALIKSISFIWNSLNYLIVFIGYAIPIGIPLVIAALIYRRYQKTK